MPRPERPLTGDSEIVRFAADLRELRRHAGNPTYRELAETAHFSKASVAEATSGRRLPSWSITSAFVLACGGDVHEWHERWQAMRAGLGRPVNRRPAADERSPASTDDPVLRRSRYSGAEQEIADDADPKRTGCAADPAGVLTLDSVEVTTADHEFLGNAELRHAPTYRVSWGRFVPSNRMLYLRARGTVTVAARRPATGTHGRPYSTGFDGQAVFGAILLTSPGGVEVTVTVQSSAGSGTATTACLR
jgi:hypothetical protein